MDVRRLLASGAVGLAAAGCGGDDKPDAPAREHRSVERSLASVPNLVGRRQEDAHRLARRAGFGIRWLGFAGKVANGRYNVPCVKVMSQSPVAGERRPRGAQIAVIEKACRVPKGWPYGV